jgi:hypothetical protein
MGVKQLGPGAGVWLRTRLALPALAQGNATCTRAKPTRWCGWGHGRNVGGVDPPRSDRESGCGVCAESFCGPAIRG